MNITKFNEYTATVVSNATGNMWFFWASLAFILVLRISHPPVVNELLLDIENDLQLLLLAANAVVGAKQLDLLTRLLKHIEKEEVKIEKEIEH